MTALTGTPGIVILTAICAAVLIVLLAVDAWLEG